MHFTPENNLGPWIESNLDFDLRGSVVARTAVTTHAPQLAAAGLGIAVVPVSAVTAGFTGAVRPFDPRWTRHLVALATSPQDPLVAQLTSDLRIEALDLHVVHDADSLGPEEVEHQIDRLVARVRGVGDEDARRFRRLRDGDYANTRALREDLAPGRTDLGIHLADRD